MFGRKFIEKKLKYCMKLFINIVLHILLIVRSYSDHSKFFHVYNYGCGFQSGMNIGFQEHFKILFKKKVFEMH